MISQFSQMMSMSWLLMLQNQSLKKLGLNQKSKNFIGRQFKISTAPP